MSNLIEALQIFLKYRDEQFPTQCEHDMLYVHVDPSVVSGEDIKRLEEIGFFIAEELECFASYVYGSC